MVLAIKYFLIIRLRSNVHKYRGLFTIFRKVKKTFGDLIFIILMKVIKRQENRILFGSWVGELYADNPKYLFEYLITFDNLELVWCGKKHIERELPKSNNVVFVIKGSLKAFYYCLTSKYIFVSQGLNLDLTSFKAFNGAIVTNLWHGVPLKKIGLDALVTKEKKDTIIRRWQKNIYREEYNYFASASQINSNIFISAFANIGARSTNMILSGTPRNDILINATVKQIAKLKQKYEKILGIPSGKRLVTYLPTFRRNTDAVFDFSQLEIADQLKLEKVLHDNNAILVDKNHFISYEKNNISAHKSDMIIKIDQSKQMEIDVQELLLVTDVLISDYSSCYLDYVLLDRPIIHFVYDYDYYKNVDSGLYFELTEVAAGPIVQYFDEMVVFLGDALKCVQLYRNERQKVRNLYMEYEQGHASETIAKMVMNLTNSI